MEVTVLLLEFFADVQFERGRTVAELGQPGAEQPAERLARQAVACCREIEHDPSLH
jgi:hypothetical protein